MAQRVHYHGTAQSDRRETENDGLLNQGNAAQFIEALNESMHHQRTLYEQIAALKAEVAMLRERSSDRF